MTVHHIKCHPKYFAAVLAGAKPFEVRFDDRAYAVGDTLVLMEFSIEEGATGREHRRVVTYVLKDFEGLSAGWVALGLGVRAELETSAGVFCMQCKQWVPEDHDGESCPNPL